MPPSTSFYSGFDSVYIAKANLSTKCLDFKVWEFVNLASNANSEIENRQAKFEHRIALAHLFRMNFDQTRTSKIEIRNSKVELRKLKEQQQQHVRNYKIGIR